MNDGLESGLSLEEAISELECFTEWPEFHARLRELIPDWLCGVIQARIEPYKYTLKVTLGNDEFDAIWGLNYVLDSRYIIEDQDHYIIDVASRINEAYQHDVELRRSGYINEYSTRRSSLWNVGE